MHLLRTHTNHPDKLIHFLVYRDVYFCNYGWYCMFSRYSLLPLHMNQDDQEGIRTVDDDNFIDDSGVDPADRYGSDNEPAFAGNAPQVSILHCFYW